MDVRVGGRNDLPTQPLEKKDLVTRIKTRRLFEPVETDHAVGDRNALRLSRGRESDLLRQIKTRCLFEPGIGKVGIEMEDCSTICTFKRKESMSNSAELLKFELDRNWK